MPHDDNSVHIGKEPCPSCGSRDNLARYSDGHGYCFGCQYYEAGDSDEQPTREGHRMQNPSELIDFEVLPLNARGISLETCKFFDYGIGSWKGQPVQVATYRDKTGRPVAQKLRTRDKDMPWRGSPREVGLYGEWLWSGTGKKLVITEGEIDCMTVSQLQNNKWPVVSLKNGASGAAKDIAASLEFVSGYEQVILMFDMDDAGRAAIEEAVRVLPFGTARVAQLPFKDANECLLKGASGEVVDQVWKAKQWTPDGIVSVNDVAEEAMRPVELGLPWVYETLTNATYGRRYSEIYGLGAGTGVGKTDVLMEQIAYDIDTLDQTVGVIMLEQMPAETLKRLAGKIMNRRFHIPDDGWTEEELREGIEKVRGKLHLYDNFGHTEWDTVSTQIRYMVLSLGHKIIYLDHLTAMADTDNERGSLEQIMKEMAGLAKELGCMIIFVSHLATPDGTPHEEGGRVSIRHFKGSRSIGFWSYFMFGLERDQQAEDPLTRTTTTFRILKDRYTGNATGQTFFLRYDRGTGRLVEVPKEALEDHGFKDEFASDDHIPF